MVVDDFRGYIEGKDITKIDVTNLVYPSKNVIVNKGKITTRGGLENDGNTSTGTDGVHSEFVWKDAVGGARPIRCTGRKVQVKFEGVWYTIYESLQADVVRVYFATWVDNNGSIVKKRLFFSDGSTTLRQWNGAMEKVASFASDTITLDTTDTGLQAGFDDGTTTNQDLRIFSLDADGVLDNTEDVVYDSDASTNTLDLTATPTETPVAGDIVVAMPTVQADAISTTYKIDVVYSYQNHLIVANYNSVELRFSHISTYSLSAGLDFTVPIASSRTALTPILVTLDGNFTAMIARKNVLWVSDSDDWYKMLKTVEVNAYGLWLDIEKFETGDRKGSLPMACAKYKGDIIYMAQDKTMQRVTSVEVLGTDEIRQISDDVEALFQRLDLTDVRVYYFERAIHVIAPVESTMVILDLIEGYFQPPQIIPIKCMSVIDGVKYGHHSEVDETYKLFAGRKDLGTPVEAKIAFAYHQGKHMFRYKWHTMVGISCRLTGNTVATVDQFFEEDGAKSTTNFEIDGSVVKTYTIDDDVSWATHPYAERSWGGADMEVAELRRAQVYSKFDAVSYFDFRIIITVSGLDNEFHLLGWYIDDALAKRKIGDDLFVSK